MDKAKAHTIYKNKVGKRVPGVTTILGNLGWNKNMLIAWSRREALAGNDPNKIRDKSADIGTCAHYLCECDAKEIKPDLSEYSQANIDIAENCFLGYLEWKKVHKIEKITSEIPLVSEKGFGGTIDMLYKSGDKLILGDIKTSKNIYLEHKIQLSAYYHLLLENNYKIDEVYILHLSKNGDFAPYKIKELDNYWEAFAHCLGLHYLKKIIY